MTIDSQLTKEECLRILNLYKNWNMGQKSSSLVTWGVRTEEDDILDARRKLIKKVIKRLEELAT